MDDFLTPEDIFSRSSEASPDSEGSTVLAGAGSSTDDTKALDLLDEIIEMVGGARGMPLSKSAVLDRDAVLDRLEQMKEHIPEDLRTARWMIREREAFVARTNEQAHEATERARERARELVSESHVLAEAVEEANILVKNAENEARRIRLEAEDYSEDHLQRLETLFSNLLQQVHDARAELHEARPAPTPPPT